MKSLIPNKDTLFLLTQIQKDIIRSYNSSHQETPAFPQYPLWAFGEAVPQKFISCTILPPSIDEGEFFFPVEIETGSGTVNLKIIFARTTLKKEQAPCLLEETGTCKSLPMKVKAYRTGNVEFSRNSWQFYDECWVKAEPAIR